MGVGRYLKEQKPSVQIVAVEPPSGELVQGLRNLDDGFVPPIFDPTILDRKFIVRPRESIEWLRRLLDDCGVFAGRVVGRRDRGRGEDGGADGVGHHRHPAPRRRAGSTSRRARGPTTSTRSSSAPPASTTGSDAVRPRGDRARRRRAARRRAGRVPDRDRLRPRCRRVVDRRGAPALRGEGPTGRPSGDRAPRRRRAARRVGRRRRRHRAHVDRRVLARPAHGRGAARRTRPRRGDRWSRHRRPARARPADRARAAATRSAAGSRRRRPTGSDA